MCGVAGILKLGGGEPDPRVLAGMHSRLAHRGPDDEGLYLQGPIALAHRRLSILDLSDAAHQPMATPDERGVLIYNGEIYNFRELRARLESEGCRFHSTGDTEVLLQACAHWGVPRAAREANGMFAFAYWDTGNEQLWLARDRTGIKPLYYAEQAGSLYFASEIRAILPAIAARPNEAALLALLSALPLQDPETPWEDVRSLPAGQVLRFDAGGRRETIPYFELTESVDADLYRELSGRAETEVVRRFSALLERSVGLHLASDARLAVMASGGLDSSIVVAHASRMMSGVTAYHADVQGPNSELSWARLLTDSLRIPLCVAQMSREDYVRSLAIASFANECPATLHPNTVPFYLVCKLAAEDGVKVLLTGEGADELLGGYPAFRAYAQRRRAVRTLRRLSEALGPLGRLGRQLVLLADSDAHFGQWSRSASLLSHGRSIRLRLQGEEAYSFIDDDAERASQADLFAYMYGYLQSILWRNDRMGMAVSLESRVPFLENDLIRFCLSLPMRYKLRGRCNKWVLRQAAAPLLPGGLAQRPKLGFPVDAAEYVGADDEFTRGGFLETVMDFDPKAVSATVNRYPEMAFRFLLMELWGRLSFLGESVDGLTERLLRRLNR